jgi:DUF971 family protein|tara:strand:+ start:1359 stop:1688 length:330 start_codon:yes stop_codon:yes gene_type:complete
MSADNKKNILIHHETVNKLLLMKWEDGLETVLELKTLREHCPCANCAGEKDVFGNIYKGTPEIKTESSNVLSGIQPIGYYALRPFWMDGHNTGIYPFELLRSLSENKKD